MLNIKHSAALSREQEPAMRLSFAKSMNYGDSEENQIVEETNLYVGCGYNAIKSPYISPEFMMTTNPILNISAKDVVVNNSIFGQSNTITGSSVKEVYTEFNAKLKISADYKLFSGDVSAEFSLSSSKNEEYAYTKLYAYFVRKKQMIKSNYENKLTKKFVADINGNLSPERLFEKYGTHLVKEVFLGGRLDFNYSTTKSISQSNKDIKAAVNASYAFVSGSASADYNEKVKQLEESSELLVRVIGGRTISAVSISDLRKSYSDWCDSLMAEENCAPCGIPSFDSFEPIWEFCDAPERKLEIENVFNRLAVSETNENLLGDSYITDIKVVHDVSNAEAARRKCPEGYHLINKNMNEGVATQFPMFLCVKRGRKEDAITNVIAQIGGWQGSAYCDINHCNITSEYLRNGADLNADKHPSNCFIFILYTRDRHYKPIKNLTVIFDGESVSDEWVGTACWENTYEPVNFNKGIGGRCINVVYKY